MPLEGNNSVTLLFVWQTADYCPGSDIFIVIVGAGCYNWENYPSNLISDICQSIYELDPNVIFLLKMGFLVGKQKNLITPQMKMKILEKDLS